MPSINHDFNVLLTTFFLLFGALGILFTGAYNMTRNIWAFYHRNLLWSAFVSFFVALLFLILLFQNQIHHPW